MMKEQIVQEFRKRYHQEPEAIFFCPGRANLIGEHIDYNGGCVMPCAIDLGTYLAIARSADNRFELQSLNFPETFSGTEIPTQKTGREWFNYPLGVLAALLETGQLQPCNLLVSGNLPIGSSLSSSASIEVLTAFALARLFTISLSGIDIALLAKKVENEFIGVNCGIMDQFAVAMGRASQAILLNCDTLQHEYLPLELGKYVLAIMNTNKPRKLVESKYNERFAECQTALKALQSALPIHHLCELDTTTFLSNAALIPDATVRKRAQHVVQENERVTAAAAALLQNDLPAVGQLMYASHASLRDLYEVSGIELDTLVSAASNFNGCIGARMTGAGFGGCAIALVEKEYFASFASEIAARYNDKIGYAPAIFASGAAAGVRMLQE